METNILPIFVWEDCLKYFGQPHLAKGTLGEYKQQLMVTRQAFNQAVKEQNPQRVTYLLNRLLGAAIYCGTQRLHRTLSDNLNYTQTVPAQIVVDEINQEIDDALFAISQFLQKQPQVEMESL